MRPEPASCCKSARRQTGNHPSRCIDSRRNPSFDGQPLVVELSCRSRHIDILRSKVILATGTLACVAPDAHGTVFIELRAQRERAPRRPRREREQTPILFGRLASARCFAEVPLAARALHGVGISFPVASCVSFHMQLVPDTRGSAERATGTTKAGAIMMQEGTLIPQSLRVETELYSDGWEIVKNSDADAVDRDVRRAGWNFFFLAANIQATAWVIGERNCTDSNEASAGKSQGGKI
jgi:hypothetical protein